MKRVQVLRTARRQQTAWLVLTALLCAQVHAQSAPTPVVVNEVRLAAMDLEKPASGTVHSRQYMMIMAGTAGRLDWIAEPGEIIQQGQALARIDVAPLQLQRQEQQLQAQRARINQDYFTREIERLESLKAEDYTSANELDRLRLNRSLASNDLAAAENRIAQLDDMIARATIQAPFTGVVSDQQRYAGEELSRTDVLARLNGIAQLELRAALPLRWLQRINPGTLITVQSSDGELIGTVRRVIPTGDRESQTFEARIDLPGETKLALGELTQLRLPQRVAASSLQIPRDALVLRRDAAFVFRVGEQAKVERINVKLGDGQGDWIAITGPLHEGDNVVVRGAERLQDGQAVEVLRNLAAEARQAHS